MLVIDLLWVVFGLGYIAYKGLKDEGFSLKDVPALLKILGIFVTPLLLIGTVASFAENSSGISKEILSIIAILLTVLLIGFCLFMAIKGWYNQHEFNNAVNKALMDTEADRAELDRLWRMSDEELGNLLGLPLSSIPLDGLGHKNLLDHATEIDRRRAYVIAFILHRKGLRYYRRMSAESGISEYPILETDGGKAFLEYIRNHGINY